MCAGPQRHDDARVEFLYSISRSAHHDCDMMMFRLASYQAIVCNPPRVTAANSCISPLYEEFRGSASSHTEKVP